MAQLAGNVGKGLPAGMATSSCRSGATFGDCACIGGRDVRHSSSDAFAAATMNRQRLKNLLAEYGRLALYTYLVLFLLVLLGFAGAIHLGVHTESMAGTAGLWGAAWLATKVTQPLRILATLALTPLVAQLLKLRKKPAPVDPTV
jgi:hypothetical protein